MNRSRSDVLRPVCDRIAVEDVAGLELGLRRLAVGDVVAHLAAGDDVGDVGGVRVHLLLLSGLKDRFEDPDSVVLQLDVNGLGVDDGRVLRRSDPGAGEHQQPAHG